eukprot:357435-Chlamydomonas_euryale.AAC.2
MLRRKANEGACACKSSAYLARCTPCYACGALESRRRCGTTSVFHSASLPLPQSQQSETYAARVAATTGFDCRAYAISLLLQAAWGGPG